MAGCSEAVPSFGVLHCIAYERGDCGAIEKLERVVLHTKEATVAL